MFVIEEEKEFFFEWLHASLFDRAPVFLVLSGAPGNGKNRLKLLLQALHGHKNSTTGKKSTLVEKFNSQLCEGTLLWFDELTYDISMENNMKELPNDYIAIERKGVDATRLSKIYASIVITNNGLRDNYIAFDSRKFVPLQLSENRLGDSMTSDEIKTFNSKVKDPASPTYDVAFIAQMAKWIKRRGYKGTWNELEYKGPMFWKLAHSSMTVWQKKAVMLLLDDKSHTPIEPGPDGYLWSAVTDSANRRNKDGLQRIPDLSLSQAFFNRYRDIQGRVVFETKSVPKSIVGDFHVKVILDDPQTAFNEPEKKEVDENDYTDL